MATVGLVLLLAACARQVPEAVEHTAQTPGFWWGVWHGFVFPFAWIGSLFDPKIAEAFQRFRDAGKPALREARS